MNKLFDLTDEEMAAEFGEPISSDAGLVSATQNVSGIGVEEVYEDNTASLEEILNSLNSSENGEMAKELEREAAEREAYQKAEEERLAEIERRYNQERYEKEQAAKAERLARQKEEEERLEREEAARREASIAGKLGKLVKGFGKKAEKESIEEQEEKLTPAAVAEEKEKVTEEPIYPEETGTVAEVDDDDLASYMDDGSIEGESAIAEEVPAEEEKAAEEPERTPEAKPETAGKKQEKKRFSLPKRPAKPAVSAVKPHTPEPEEIDWKFIAQHDELTGLLNTRGYKEAIESLPLTAAVVFFDVNNLKYVNDNFSHSAGNDLLIAVSKQIADNFGEENSFRIGGDEFVAFVRKPGKSGADKISKVIGEIHGELSSIAKDNKEKIPYSVSAGFALGDGKHSIEDLLKAADAAMYRNKRAYKESHPQFAARKQEGPKPEAIQEQELDHDELLSSEQRELKERIATNHKVVSNMSTMQVVREIQKKAPEIRAIFIASANFDHLFIIRDVNDFINIVLEQNAVIDYSYLYVVYEGGPCYYGAQEYYTEVTHIFESITEGLLSGKFKSVKDIQSIKGINIFRNVYI